MESDVLCTTLQGETMPGSPRRQHGKTVLVCGANGFIGKALCAALARDGHRVIRGVRQASQADEVAIDYTTDLAPAAWLPRLRDVEVVINAVGIVGERDPQTFDRIHRDAPIALFDACRDAGIQRIIQISALGAQTGDARFLQSKRAADEHLQSLPVPHHILRPALVYGAKGTSASYFRALASAPIHMLPAGGTQLLRPVHIDDLAEIVVQLLNTEHAHQAAVLDVVGQTQVDYRQMLATYRASMGLPAPWRLSIPAWLMDIGASVLSWLPGSLVNRETWRMLQAGNTADPQATAQALGRAPAGIESFIRPH